MLEFVASVHILLNQPRRPPHVGAALLLHVAARFLWLQLLCEFGRTDVMVWTSF